ncbi:MAG: hypothetical protein INQ03_25985 [Candidatus Heimdallarchaeota archaeon]|nr:hypothetical protein [Candidatus Heimdallarchaeota archaeon]
MEYSESFDLIDGTIGLSAPMQGIASDGEYLWGVGYRNQFTNFYAISYGIATLQSEVSNLKSAIPVDLMFSLEIFYVLYEDSIQSIESSVVYEFVDFPAIIAGVAYQDTIYILCKSEAEYSIYSFNTALIPSASVVNDKEITMDDVDIFNRNIPIDGICNYMGIVDDKLMLYIEIENHTTIIAYNLITSIRSNTIGIIFIIISFISPIFLYLPPLFYAKLEENNKKQIKRKEDEMNEFKAIIKEIDPLINKFVRTQLESLIPRITEIQPDSLEQELHSTIDKDLPKFRNLLQLENLKTPKSELLAEYIYQQSQPLVDELREILRKNLRNQLLGEGESDAFENIENEIDRLLNKYQQNESSGFGKL